MTFCCIAGVLPADSLHAMMKTLLFLSLSLLWCRYMGRHIITETAASTWGLVVTHLF